MPTYEYRCPNGHDFEHFFRKMSDAAAELPCPTCGATAERRVSGGAGLVFKGSGFYITDYKKDGSKAREGEGSEGGSGESSKSEGAKDSTKSSGEAKSGQTKPAPSKGTNKPE